MEDKNIICKDCGNTFVFNVQEQKFYKDRGLLPPKRCRYCRNQRKQKFERREENGY